MSSNEGERLQVIQQSTRANIIQNILGHPENAPSLAEIVYYNPSKSESTIRDHLDTLMDSGVVTRVELPEDRRSRDDPYVFFALSEEGWRTLNRYTVLLPEIDEIEHDHERVEKTQKIERYERAPRPTLDPEGERYIHSETLQ